MFPRGGTIGDMAHDVLMPAALASLIIGMVGVLGARDLGRTVAYSVIGSVGTMMLAFAQFDQGATAAGLYYMVHSTFAAAALFLIIDIVRMRRGVRGLSISAAQPMQGHGLLAAGFFAAAIAMAGMPPLSGFIGKLLIMDALRDVPDGYALWAAILITSLIAIYGFAKSGSTVFWRAYAEDAASLGDITERKETPFLAISAAFAPIAVLVGLVVFAGPADTWMRATAAQIFDPQIYISAVMDGAYERAMDAAEAGAHPVVDTADQSAPETGH
jgi:multicomponent K+:H+ antiporter subunit D